MYSDMHAHIILTYLKEDRNFVLEVDLKISSKLLSHLCAI